MQKYMYVVLKYNVLLSANFELDYYFFLFFIEILYHNIEGVALQIYRYYYLRSFVTLEKYSFFFKLVLSSIACTVKYVSR